MVKYLEELTQKFHNLSNEEFELSKEDKSFAFRKYEELYKEFTSIENEAELCGIEYQKEIYNCKFRICEALVFHEKNLKELYIDKEIECLNRLLELCENKENIYEKLVDALNEKDSIIALNECNKIIFDESYRNKHRINKYIFIEKKLKYLKCIFKINNINKQHKSIYNDEIILCYEQLIKYYKNSENSNKYVNYYLKEELEYLLNDNLNKQNVLYALNKCENELKEEFCDLYFKFKMQALNSLDRYEECIYFYKSEVEANSNLDTCFIDYIGSLYMLDKFDQFKGELKYKKFQDPMLKYGFNILKLRVAIKEKDIGTIKEILEETYNSSNKNIPFRALNALIKLASNKNEISIYTKQMNELYYNQLNEKSVELGDNYQEYSNIIMKLLNDGESSDKLYHYTNINALKGIVENRELWVTEAGFLNDASETKYVLKYFKSILENIYNADFRKDMESVYTGLKYYFGEKLSEEESLSVNLKEYIDESLRTKLKNAYILSLSKNKDSLTLWGNYCNNEGYNLGFNKDDLIYNFTRSTQKQYDFPVNGQVIYKNVPKQNISEDSLYNEIKQYYDKSKKYKVDNNKMISALIENIVYIGLFIKQECFAHEEEYRVVFIRNEETEKDQFSLGCEFQTNFKIKENAFIPYIKVPFNNNDIKSVMIGPNNNSDIAFDGLNRLLEYNKYKIDKVEKSDIPLRY